jgi:hypothetical protein
VGAELTHAVADAFVLVLGASLAALCTGAVKTTSVADTLEGGPLSLVVADLPDLVREAGSRARTAGHERTIDRPAIPATGSEEETEEQGAEEPSAGVLASTHD